MNRPDTELPARFERNVLRRGLIGSREKVLVAVSGGVDSMVLLHLLAGLAPEHGWQLLVAHFNHQLRGHAANADEALVCQTSEKMGLPCVTERADVLAFAKRSRLSVEMAARKLRHEFFARAARTRGAGSVALAHHADDQVELFFIRLLRGSGPDALAGMKWKAPSPADPGVVLIRPLLDQTKTTLTRFALAKKIAYREDATNKLTDYARNRIRHELLPLLRKKYQPGLDRAILRIMDMIGAEAEWAFSTARDILGSSVLLSSTGSVQPHGRPKVGAGMASFADLPLALQRRLIQIQLADSGAEPDFDLVEALRLTPNKPVSVAPGLSAHRGTNGTVRIQSSVAGTFRSDRVSANLTHDGRVVFGGVQFAWELRSPPAIPPRVAVVGRELFDAQAVGSEVVLRHWQPGDRFQPAGMTGPVKLQDIFCNRKVLRNRRYELILATTSQNEVFWVEGLRIAERFKLTSDTKQCLVWRWQRLKNARKSPN